MQEEDEELSQFIPPNEIIQAGFESNKKMHTINPTTEILYLCEDSVL